MSILYAYVNEYFSESLYTDLMPRLPKAEMTATIDSTHETIGKRIARLRKISGLTQKDLAEKIGVTRTVITDYESGRVRIYDEMLARLALILNISSDEILGLKSTADPISEPSLRIVKRVTEIDKLPEAKKKAILKTLDDLIRANS